VDGGTRLDGSTERKHMHAARARMWVVRVSARSGPFSVAMGGAGAQRHASSHAQNSTLTPTSLARISRGTIRTRTRYFFFSCFVFGSCVENMRR